MFKYIALIAVVILAFSSTVFLPKIYAHLKTSPEINYYYHHPDMAYEVFSACRAHVDDAGDCYDAYSAAVALADSKDCSAAGVISKRKFKLLVEHTKEDYISLEIQADCQPETHKSALMAWFKRD